MVRSSCRDGGKRSLVQALLRALPGLPTVAMAAVILLLHAWSCERKAGRQVAANVQQIEKQAKADIAPLQQRATAELRDTKQSAQLVQSLEKRRRELEEQVDTLRQNLDSLRGKEGAQTNNVTSLPVPEVVSRVASRLKEQAPSAGGQASELLRDPLTRPTPAEENAVAVHPLPQGGEGRAAMDGGEGKAARSVLVLSGDEARKVETAFVELDSCRQQTQVMEKEFWNRQQQARLEASISEQQSETIAKLNTALAEKDQIIKRAEQAHRAELKAIRGMWRSRCHTSR